MVFANMSADRTHSSYDYQFGYYIFNQATVILLPPKCKHLPLADMQWGCIRLQVNYSMNRLYDYIEKTKVRTAMYIGENTLTAMYFHLQGYFAACDEYGILDEEMINFSGFHDFVAKYYSYRESTAGWRDIILRENNCDEKQSLLKFFELLHLYRQGIDLPNSLLP